MSLTRCPRRTLAGLVGSALAGGMLVAAPPPAGAEPPELLVRAPATRSQVFLDWERIAMRAVYTEGLSPIPSGVPVLGFTSMAMRDAALTSLARRRSSEKAAVAAAAHGVLTHYVPVAVPSLGANLLATLAGVPDGRAETRGRRIGEAAAAGMIASRAGDGWGDESIHYTKPPGIGVWQPVPPAVDMLVPWLASLRPLVVTRRIQVDGPDAVTTRAYARDFAEVKAEGGATSTVRTARQSLTALFFNSNSATMVGDALLRRLQGQPVGLRLTSRLFAAMHASMTDTVIRCWQLKRTIGFWRPAAAIAAAADDGNPATTADPSWTSLVPSPPYADYVSGHACLTAPAVEVIRRLLGERTSLELVSVNAPRSRVYGDLSSIERQALNARIWSGLHFRDAMVDGYALGHETARRVLAQLP